MVPVRPFKGLQLSIPLAPGLPVANEFLVELSHKPRGASDRRKTKILHCWLHTGFMRGGAGGNRDGGALVLPKAELDGLVKKDRDHTVHVLKPRTHLAPGG